MEVKHPPMITSSNFISQLCNIANQKTVYAWGMFGSPITQAIVNGKAKQYPSWYTEYRIETIFSPLYGRKPLAWGFDCIGLIKAVLWGWRGENDKTYGGAVYASNGVPDISADAMINKCYQVSADFSEISKGEYLWMKGHCGIYIGNGKVVESTPKWGNGVQITALSDRDWLKHGKLPYVEYDVKVVENTVTIELFVLRKGSKCDQVKTLQRLLNAFGHSLEVDGDFGSKTYSALIAYQKANKLEVDGICGINSWSSLLK